MDLNETNKRSDTRRIMEVPGMMCLSYGLIHRLCCLNHVRGGIRECGGLGNKGLQVRSVVLSSRDCLSLRLVLCSPF